MDNKPQNSQFNLMSSLGLTKLNHLYPNEEREVLNVQSLLKKNPVEIQSCNELIAKQIRYYAQLQAHCKNWNMKKCYWKIREKGTDENSVEYYHYILEKKHTTNEDQTDHNSLYYDYYVLVPCHGCLCLA